MQMPIPQLWRTRVPDTGKRECMNYPAGTLVVPKLITRQGGNDDTCIS